MQPSFQFWKGGCFFGKTFFAALKNVEKCVGCGKPCGNCVKLRKIKGSTAFADCGKSVGAARGEFLADSDFGKRTSKKGKLHLNCDRI
jgi:hypothetical protein